MLLDNYDYETVRADEVKSGDFIWCLSKPCRVLDVTTSFTAIVGCGMYGTASFIWSNNEPQIRILNSGALF